MYIQNVQFSSANLNQLEKKRKMTLAQEVSYLTSLDNLDKKRKLTQQSLDALDKKRK